jgi:hypothetical protein
LQKTNMVDFAMDIYKNLHNTEEVPKGKFLPWCQAQASRRWIDPRHCSVLIIDYTWQRYKSVTRSRHETHGSFTKRHTQ